MNNKIEKETLAYKGLEFQYAAVKALVEDPDLLVDIYKILDQNLFSDTWLRSVVGTIKDQYKRTGLVPNYAEIELALRDKATNGDDMEYYEETLDKVRSSKSLPMKAVKENLTDFFKWKFYRALLNKSLQKVDGGWDEKSVQKTIAELETIRDYGQDNTTIIETSNMETAVSVLSQGDEEIVPTGIPEIDKRLAGGLAKKDIGLFAAPTGFGKTTFGTILAHNAAVAGYKTVQIFFEDEPAEIFRKHLAMETHRSISELRNFDEEYAEKWARALYSYESMKALNENLIILKMENGETTVEDIEAKLVEISNLRDFRPEMLVIDYFGCLKHSNNYKLDQWEQEARCMKKIKEKLAYKYNLAVWVLQQTNRASYGREAQASQANWQGSIKATQPSSVWIEMKRTPEQKIKGRCDLVFHKTRRSRPLDDLNDIKFDNGYLTIDCSTADYAFDDDEELEYKEE